MTTNNTEQAQGNPVLPGLFSVRTALILLIAVNCAVLVGGLTYLCAGSAPAALLAALASFASVTMGLHTLIDNV